jgi:undecaprenyl-diphosphatase
VISTAFFGPNAQAIDESLLIWLNSVAGPQTSPIAGWLSNKYIWIPWYALLIWLLYSKLPWRRASWVIFAAVMCFTAADAIGYRVIKPGFARLRPCYESALAPKLHLESRDCGGKYGFVSSHASNTAAAAMLVGFGLRGVGVRRWLWPLLAIWVLAVSASRVALGVHYPTDIFFGAVLGVLVSLVGIWCVRQWAESAS